MQTLERKNRSFFRNHILQLHKDRKFSKVERIINSLEVPERVLTLPDMNDTGDNVLR